MRNLLPVNREGGEEIESEVVVAARCPDLYVRNLLSVNSESVPENDCNEIRLGREIKLNPK